MNRYTPAYITQVNNKDLPSSTGNSTQYLVMEKNLKNNTHIIIYIILHIIYTLYYYIIYTIFSYIYNIIYIILYI